MSVLPPLTAEKLVLSGYIILLPVAIRYALRAIHVGAGFLAVLALPFIYNNLLHMGFYNFVYSLAMFFVVLGYWLRHHEDFALRQTLIFTALTLLLYACHVFALLMAYGTIGVLTIWMIGFDLAPQLRQQVNWRELGHALRRRALPLLCAFTPTLILTVVFMLQFGHGRSHALPADYLLNNLAHLAVLISYDEREGWGSTALAGLFAVMTSMLLVMKVARRQVNRWDGFLLVVVAYMTLYFNAPETTSQGGYISSRLSLFTYLGLLLWYGGTVAPRFVRWSTQLVAVGIALLLLGLHIQKYVELNDYLEEYLSGKALIAPNTTLLPLIFSPQGAASDGRLLSSLIQPFEHASGHIAVQRGVVDLSNYEAQAKVFPVKFRPRLDPGVHIWYKWRYRAPQLEFLSYPERTGGRVDYILIWRTAGSQESIHC
jgi:hypothetical protein